MKVRDSDFHSHTWPMCDRMRLNFFPCTIRIMLKTEDWNPLKGYEGTSRKSRNETLGHFFVIIEWLCNVDLVKKIRAKGRLVL